MSTTFQAVAQTEVDGSLVYAWSNPANWTFGVPVDGGQVTVPSTGFGGGLDDIANLFLDSLTLATNLGVAGALTIGTLDLSGGLIIASGNASSALTIDALTGSGEIAAFGGVATVLGPSPSGESYEVAPDGEVVLAAAPGAASAFFYDAQTQAGGTFAFRAPGATIFTLDNVGVGDAIALPGSFVSAVTYGTSSLSITTDLDTTTFANVTYEGTTPTGYTVSTDPTTGLELVTFTGSPATSFQQVTTTTVGGLSLYLWSTAANWTNGVPVDGAPVTFDIDPSLSAPDGDDDIANLFLATLNMAGQLTITGSLTVGTLAFESGNVTKDISSTTFFGNASASLTIDALSGFGQIDALGAHAVTDVLSTTDPGDIYAVDQGGELELHATPNAASSFLFDNDGTADGTFAFFAPGGTISAALLNVAIGDSIALPGSFAAVTFGTSSLSITTDLGTTTFSDVSYEGTTPTGYTVSTDPTTGLELVTFTAASATSFQAVAQTEVDGSLVYAWSNPANWTFGVPVDGGQVTVPSTGFGGGLDDIANLFLDSLTLATNLGVAGALTIGTLDLSGGLIIASGNASSALTIDALTGSGEIAAFGGVATVLGPSPSGESYEVAPDGEVVLAAAPGAASAFFYDAQTQAGGTFAFRAPGATIFTLDNVGVGDAIALPGSFVSAVTYGTSSLSITTDLDTTTFANVTYEGTTPTGYTVSTDPTTGLELVTFTGSPATSFQQVTTTTVGGLSLYLWSTAANWTNGVPVDGAPVTFDIDPSLSAPDGDDDIANLFLATLNMAGQLTITGSLTVGTLAFESGNVTKDISSTTFFGNASASLTIDALSGFGQIDALGAHAVTDVLSTTDPGDIYAVDQGGELELHATPNAASSFLFDNDGTADGTFAFFAPGGTISAALLNVAIGDSIALPGSFAAVTFGTSSLSITTDLGTTTFSDVSYEGTTPTGYTVSTDPTTGLELVTFTETPSTVTALTESPETGTLATGESDALTLTMNEAVTVTGAPTLALNDGGTATYDAAKSTSTSLVFDYTVASTDASVPALAATSIVLPAGSAVVDASGGVLATLSLIGLTQIGPKIQAPISFSEDGKIDTYTIPKTGTYEITAIGATGGAVVAQTGGAGAEVHGEFILTAGDVIEILVGGVGGSNGNDTGGIGGDSGLGEAGGGGGSFVVLEGTPNVLLEAAGGGGGAAINGFISVDGGPGLAGTGGGNSTAAGAPGPGGQNGEGGGSGGLGAGGGGAGYIGNGDSSGGNADGGVSFEPGGAAGGVGGSNTGGGAGGNAGGASAFGGFGGGGAGNFEDGGLGSGGGGGYSGGGAGSSGDGGGGGSFVASDATNVSALAGENPNGDGAVVITQIACYCRGTLILTDAGEVAVEDLAIGGNVMTVSGAVRPIKWIGQRSYSGRFVMGRTDILPICIKAGALDDNVPRRDLWISPHHAMHFETANREGMLIEAKDLVNGGSIVQIECFDKVEYFHIELDTHDVIIAEGAPSESFIDDDSRGMFHNAHEYGALYPNAAATRQQYCAQRLDDGYEVENARQSIALRAGLMRSADMPPIGVLRGNVDLVSRRSIEGWAQNTDHSEAPVCLDILFGRRLIGQTLANRYRADLLRAGLGSGRHAFEFTPPTGIDLAPDTVEVRRSLDGAALEISADPVRAFQPHTFGPTKRFPIVTVHRRAVSW